MLEGGENRERLALERATFLRSQGRFVYTGNAVEGAGSRLQQINVAVLGGLPGRLVGSGLPWSLWEDLKDELTLVINGSGGAFIVVDLGERGVAFSQVRLDGKKIYADEEGFVEGVYQVARGAGAEAEQESFDPVALVAAKPGSSCDDIAIEVSDACNRGCTAEAMRNPAEPAMRKGKHCTSACGDDTVTVLKHCQSMRAPKPNRSGPKGRTK